MGKIEIRYLIDTNIIIYYLNGDQTAIQFIDNYIEESALSIITYLEVLVYPYNHEEAKIVEEFLELFPIYEIDMHIAKVAIENVKKRKVKIADNLIAATTKYYDLVLVTRNVSDFQGLGIQILNPFD